ncbi:MAG: hypothetical protein ABIB11_00365 [Candidatus Omnitrophota bacterium]
MRGKRRCRVLRFLYKPRFPAEIVRLLGLSKKNSVSYILSDFVESGIAVCLNPASRTGRLYSLTDKGREALRTLLREENKEVIFTDIPIELIPLYSEIVSSRRKSAILKGLNEIPRPPQEIRFSAKRYDNDITRVGAYHLLNWFCEKGVALSCRKNKKLAYRLSDKGKLLKEILVK